jgi:hypothetical protein
MLVNNMNISVKEYAKKVGRSEIIIRQQCREDKLICCKRGRDWFIDEEQEYPFWSKHEKTAYNILDHYVKMLNDDDAENIKNQLAGALFFAWSSDLIKGYTHDYYYQKYIE